MTYQLSYCVFIAATVEAYVMKNSSTEVANEAAQTLSAAMRVLYNEAKHTPGISRSLDTIRRQIATWKLKGTSSGNSFRQAPSHTHTSSQNLTHGLNGAGQASHFGSINGSLSVGRHLDESNAVIHGTEIPYHAQQMDAHAFAGSYHETLLPRGENDFVIGDFDTGAGFHPDACPWSFGDLSYFQNA